jgi:hypothetical protein
MGGVMYVGIWSWLDSAELRAALRTYGSELAPIVYLDFPCLDIPDRFREYRGDPQLDGEPPPLDVMAAMYQHPSEPWKVRDSMLRERGWRPGSSEDEWRRELADRNIRADAAALERQRLTAEANAHEERAYREAWLKEQREIQKGWAKWMRWWEKDRQMAEAYRHRHQAADGDDRTWLLEFPRSRAWRG